MKIAFILILFFVFILDPAISQDANETTNVKVVYLKREKIDLEDMSIQGSLVTPGDLIIDTEKNTDSEMIFRRNNYNDRLPINIEYVY
jgi:hypothetical protein